MVRPAPNIASVAPDDTVVIELLPRLVLLVTSTVPTLIDVVPV